MASSQKRGSRAQQASRSASRSASRPTSRPTSRRVLRFFGQSKRRTTSRPASRPSLPRYRLFASPRLSTIRTAQSRLRKGEDFALMAILFSQHPSRMHGGLLKPRQRPRVQIDAGKLYCCWLQGGLYRMFLRLKSFSPAQQLHYVHYAKTQRFDPGGRLPSTLRVWKKLLKSAKSRELRAEVALDLGNYYRRKKQYDKALAVLDRGHGWSKVPQRRHALSHAQAKAFRGKGHWRGALVVYLAAFFEAAKALLPRRAERSLEQMYAIHRDRKMWSDAIRILGLMARLQATRQSASRAYHTMAFVYHKQRKWRQELEALWKAFRASISQKSVYCDGILWRIARLNHQQLQDWRAAEAAYRKLLTLDPLPALRTKIHYHLSDIAGSRDNWKEALKQLKLALRGVPNGSWKATLYERQFEVYIRLYKEKQAFEAILKARYNAQNPDRKAWYTSKVAAYYASKGRHELSRKYHRVAIAMARNPNARAMVLRNLAADQFAHWKQPKQALANTRKAIALATSADLKLTLYNNLGTFLARQGKRRAALAAYRKGLQVRGGHPGHRAYLLKHASVQYAYFKQWKEAIAYAARAHLETQDSAIRSQMAMWRAEVLEQAPALAAPQKQRKRLALAAKILRAALMRHTVFDQKLVPLDFQAQYSNQYSEEFDLLLRLYLRLGQTQEAMKTLEWSRARFFLAERLKRIRGQRGVLRPLAAALPYARCLQRIAHARRVPGDPPPRACIPHSHRKAPLAAQLTAAFHSNLKQLRKLDPQYHSFYYPMQRKWGALLQSLPRDGVWVSYHLPTSGRPQAFLLQKTSKGASKWSLHVVTLSAKAGDLRRKVRRYVEGIRRVSWLALRPRRVAMLFHELRQLKAKKPALWRRYLRRGALRSELRGLLKRCTPARFAKLSAKQKLFALRAAPKNRRIKALLHNLFSPKLGRQLYRILWKPVAQKIRKARDVEVRLAVVGELARLPFGMLVTSYRKNRDRIRLLRRFQNYDGLRFLLARRRWRFSYELSVDSLRRPRFERSRVGLVNTLMVGNPLPACTHPKACQRLKAKRKASGLMSPTLELLKRLGHWSHLARDLRQQKGKKARKIWDLSAPPACVKEHPKRWKRRCLFPQMEKARNIYFYTHGLLPHEARQAQATPKHSGSALLLKARLPYRLHSRDLLYAPQLLRLNLSQSQLVFLAACSSGLGGIPSREGFQSMARSFRLAGARSIAMTLWAVPELDSANLLRYFRRSYTRHGRAAQALSVAQRRLLRTGRKNPPSKASRRHPFYWASFVLFGRSYR